MRYKSLLSVIVLFLTSFAGFAQSIKEQLSTAINRDNSFGSLEIQFGNTRVISDIEIVDVFISDSTAGSVATLERSIVLEVEENNKLISKKNHSNFDLFEGDMLAGHLRDVGSLKNGNLLLIENSKNFKYSSQSTYQLYYVQEGEKQLIKVPFEEESYANTRCLSSNLNKEVNIKTGDEVVIEVKSIISNSGNCESPQSESISKWIFNEKQRSLIPKSLKASTPVSISPLGIWQQNEHFINQSEQRGSPMFEFDDKGNIILWKRNYQTFTHNSQLIGSYSVDEKDQTLKYRFNDIDNEYIGKIYIKEDTMLQEAMALGEQGFFDRTLVCSRAKFQEPTELLEKKINTGSDIGLLDFVDAVFAQREDLVSLYLKRGFDLSSFMNIKYNDRYMQGFPIHFVALSGKVDMMKTLIDGGADLNKKTFEQRSVYDFAAMSGNEEMIDFLEPYKAGMDDSSFPGKNWSELEKWFRKQKNWNSEEGNVEISLPKVSNEILFYNVWLSYPTEQQKYEQFCVYYTKSKDGLWISESDSPDFPSRVRGKCRELFVLGNDLFMFTTQKSGAEGSEKLGASVLKFDPQSKRFLKTNLNFSYGRKMYACDYSNNIYSIDTNDRENGTFVLETKSETYTACKRTSEIISKTKYFWSNRQHKFLETSID